MNFTDEKIQEMAKIQSNDTKHDAIKLDYQDGIYYGFQLGFKKALICLCPRIKNDNCDRKEPCIECETCKYLSKIN